MRPFVLNLLVMGAGHPSPPPAAGEEVGIEMMKLARSFEEMSGSSRHHASLASIFYNLAADSYQLAADASIGHARTARYEEVSNAYRKKADELGEILDKKV